MAGCPRCSCELPRVNLHKPTITHPNGLISFKELRVGETINLPDEWFHPAREHLPSTYYKILPHHDGVTRGTLGDSPELDPAVTAVARLAALDDSAFVQAVGDAGKKVDAAVNGADAAKAKLVRDATHWAWQRNRDLAAAVAANDRAAVTRARLDIQNALSTALGNAHLAIQARAPASSSLQSAAKAAVAALSADPNYCTSVTHPGTPVNAAVHRFKLAWNASQTPKVPVGTGTYEVATTVALAQVLGAAPSACGAGGRPVPAPKAPPPEKKEAAAAVTAPEEEPSGWPWGTIALGAAVAAAAGGIAWIATRPSPERRAPVTRREYAT